MKKKKWLFLTMLALAVMLVCAGCGGNDAPAGNDTEPPAAAGDGETAARDSLVIVEPNEWLGMDLLQTAYYTSMQTLVADPILMLAEDGSIQPCLASAYSVSEDGKTITLTIPEGLRFATGEPLLPEDVKASLEHGLEVSPVNTDYAAIQSIEVDGNDVILYLDEYSASVLFYLTWQYVTVIDKDQITEMSDDELLWSAVPYGLYTLDEFVPGSHASLKPNPYYSTLYPGVTNKGPAPVENVTVKFMTDDFSIVQGLKAGEIDVAFQVSFDNLVEFEDNDEFVISYNDPAFSVYTVLNNDNEFFADDRVCEAVMAIIDREQMTEWTAMYKPSYSHVLENMMGFDQDIYDYFQTTYCNDPERAQQLLADAGFADTNGDGYLDRDGKTLEFTAIFYYAKAAQAAEILQIQFKEAGIKMNIEQMEYSLWADATANENYDMAIGLYGSDFGGGATITARVRDTNILTQEQTEQFYDYVDQSGRTVDSVESAKLLAEAQRILIDSKRIFPLCQVRMASVYRSGIEGIQFLSTQGGVVMINDVK